MNVGSLLVDSIELRLRQEAQARQVLMKVSAQFSVVGAAVGRQRARSCGLMAERNGPQFGELSGDDLLGDVVLPCQTWRHQKFQTIKINNTMQILNPLVMVVFLKPLDSI